MVTMLKPVIFVASDSAGDTGEAVVRAAAVQFDPLQVEIRRVPFLQEITDIDRMIRTVVERNGAIVFTLVIPELRDYLIEEAERAGIVYIDVLGPVIRTLEHTLKQEARHLPGMIHKLDEDYFKKVEAIEFAVKYDDGRDFSGVLQADIVLVGVSRTSKTPLSMYLAHKKIQGRECAAGTGNCTARSIVHRILQEDCRLADRPREAERDSHRAVEDVRAARQRHLREHRAHS